MLAVIDAFVVPTPSGVQVIPKFSLPVTAIFVIFVFPIALNLIAVPLTAFPGIIALYLSLKIAFLSKPLANPIRN